MDANGFCLEEYLDYLRDFPYEGRHLLAFGKSFTVFLKGRSIEILLLLPGAEAADR